MRCSTLDGAPLNRKKKQNSDDEKVVDETKTIIGDGGHKKEWIFKEMDEKEEKTVVTFVMRTG